MLTCIYILQVSSCILFLYTYNEINMKKMDSIENDRCPLLTNQFKIKMLNTNEKKKIRQYTININNSSTLSHLTSTHG